MKKNGLSIIICCYNSADKLPKTLDHIITQKARDFEWEVILVDNNSTDLTVAVAEEAFRNIGSNINFHLVREPKPGLAFARMAGISAARYEYIVFCDDDNWLCETYIDTTYSILNSDPKIGAVGGCGIATTDGDIPEWFEAIKIGYATGPQAKETGDITSKGYLYGAGMGTRKSLFKEMYNDFPSILLGRTGKKMTSGEDTEYCLRLVLKGYKLFYIDKLVFKHFIQQERLTIDYRDKLFQSFRDTDIVINKYFHAIKTISKTNGRISKYLLVIKSLAKYIFSFRPDKRQKGKNIFFLLTPYQSKTDQQINAIKAFINKQTP